MRVFSPNFDYLYNIKTYSKLQEVKKYIGKNVMTLVIAASDDVAYFLQKNAWIIDDENEPFIVKHIEQTDELITVIAYGGHALLEQRITGSGALKTGTLIKTGSHDAVVKYLINQCVSDLPITTAELQGGTSISEQSRLKNLGDEVTRILTGSGYGEIWTFDVNNKCLIFDTYLGNDLSAGNPEDNPPVVFDTAFKNISDYTYTEDATVEQTTVYAGGAGEGDDREILIVGDSVAGIDRVERFIDARDVDAGDTDTLTARANQSVILENKTVVSTAVVGGGFEYGVDYQLGDIVSTKVPVKTYEENEDYFDPIEYVIQVNERITEVCISRENDLETIDLTFGDAPITQTQTQQLKTEVAQLKAAGSSGGSARSLTGEIKLWVTNSAPEGWLICDGSAISRETYADLFGIISATFGSGDGSTTFNLPNLKDRVPVGLNSADTEFDVLGKIGGEKTHTLTIDEIPSHRHGLLQMSDQTTGPYEKFNYFASKSSQAWTTTDPPNQNVNSTKYTGGSLSHNNLQPYIVLNYIIKY